MNESQFPRQDTPASSATEQPQGSASFGSVPQPPASFGKIPQPAEDLRSGLSDATEFRNVRQAAEKTDQHTLTVRDVVRLFEDRGVARSERSIVNWCQPSERQIARLDAYYEVNERRYYITGESVERVIQEELAKAARTAPGINPSRNPESTSEEKEPAEAFRNVLHEKEATSTQENQSDSSDRGRSQQSIERELNDLRASNRNLEISNWVKDGYIKKMEENTSTLIKRIEDKSYLLGQLETQLLQLSGPDSKLARRLPIRSDDDYGDQSTDSRQD